MILIGILVLVPSFVPIYYTEDIKYIGSFIIPSFISIFFGLLLCILFKEKTYDTHERRSMFVNSTYIVLISWAWGILIGSIPFVLGHQLTFLQAIFESVSGWTTTGLSVMDVSVTPKIYLFHRSFMQYCGGLGFIMVMITIVSCKQSMNLFDAEGHPDKLMPNIKKTGQTVFIMYNTYLILGIIASVIVGMGMFDSICHTMCSLSTGGFSTKLNSIGEYNNLGIDIVTIILMLIGTTNFAVLLLVSKFKLKQAFKVSEFKFMFVVLILFIPITAISLVSYLDMPIFESIRRASFDIVSALSTTGYSSMSYSSWPQFAIGVLILMMLIGGGIGSTAGGIKMSRICIMLKIIWSSIKRKVTFSNSVETNYYIKAQGKTLIDKEIKDDTLTFIITYLLIFIAGSFMITITANCSLIEAMFEFASSLGTVGLSIGITNPTTNDPTMIVEIIGMILGRLEIFIVLVGIYSGSKQLLNKLKK